MATYIIAYGPVSGSCVIDGEYVKSYDPSAHGGRGDATFTDDKSEAMRFDSVADAWAFATQVPPERPTRADGRANRPLTAFTLEFVSDE